MKKQKHNPLVVVLFLFASLLIDPVTMGVPVDKYIPSPCTDSDSLFKPEYVSLQLARMPVSGSTIVPIVAAYEIGISQKAPDRIRLSWWDPRYGGWRSLFRAYGLITDTPGFFNVPSPSPHQPERDPVQASTWPWSDNIGLAAGPNVVFVVYKGAIKNTSGMIKLLLLVDRFFWNERLGRLEPSGYVPYRIPLKDLGFDWSGFQVWAGYVNHRLLVVTQTFVQGKPTLTLLQSEKADMPGKDLSLRSSWAQPRTLAQGGWDFDTRLDGENLSYVCRTDTWPLIVPMPPFDPHQQRGNIMSDEQDWNLNETDLAKCYQNLTLQTVNVYSGARLLDETGIPGCEHPQIQNLNPLCLTCDRALQARFIVKEQIVPSERRGSYNINTMINNAAKIVLLKKKEEGWAVGRLYDLPFSVVPHPLIGRENFQDMIGLLLEPQEGERLSFKSIKRFVTYATLHPVTPVFLINSIFENTDQKGDENTIEILHHSLMADGVVITRYGLNGPPPIFNVQYYGIIKVLDINHWPIPDLRDLNILDTNWQFQPWSLNLPVDFSQGQGILQGMPFNYHIEVAGPSLYADNTLGGGLIAAKSANPLTFFAYTDLGDGGQRVIYDDDLPLPQVPPIPPLSPDAKITISDDVVTGPGSTTDEWIELDNAFDYRPIEIPEYRNGPLSASPVTTIEKSLDPLFWFLTDYTHGPDRSRIYYLDQQTLSQVAYQIMDFTVNLGPIYSSASGTSLVARLQCPPILFTDTKIPFKTDQSTVPPGSTYVWDFGPGVSSITTTETIVFQVFPEELFDFSAPDNVGATKRQISLTVKTLDGQEATAIATLEFQQNPWSQFWSQYKTTISHLSDLPGLGDVALTGSGDITITFSKYSLDFSYLGSNSPKEIYLTVRPKYTGDIRFSGTGTGQGFIDFRPRAEEFTMKNVKTGTFWDNFIEFEKIYVSYNCEQRFTPGVLVSEINFHLPKIRQQLLPNNAEANDSSDPAIALTMKPVKAAELSNLNAEISCHLTTLGDLSALAGFLVAIGLGSLAFYISLGNTLIHRLAAISVAAAAAALVILIAWILLNVPSAVEHRIENKIKSNLISNSSYIHARYVYSGQGLAEAIAVETLRKVYQTEPAATGTNRLSPRPQYFSFPPQFWQMIYVSTGRCRLLIRKPN